MKRLALLIFVLALSACGRPANVTFQIPGDFKGWVHVVIATDASQDRKDTVNIQVAKDGHAQAVNLPLDVMVNFQGVERSMIQAYTESIKRTGDNLPVGGSIDFFVGTAQDLVAHPHAN